MGRHSAHGTIEVIEDGRSARRRDEPREIDWLLRGLFALITLSIVALLVGVLLTTPDESWTHGWSTR